MPWDLEAAIAHLRTHAAGSSKGECAKYTRQAIEAGGLRIGRTTYARDYGQSLLTAGFRAFDGEPPGGYAKGDVAIIEGFTGHPIGHMQMFDGTIWISDFKQKVDFWPGPAWRKVPHPAFKIYRYSGTIAPVSASVTPPGATTYPGTPLREGSRGPQVKALQQKLRSGSVNLPIDGVFGPQTQSRVREFQRARGLPADGVVGPTTWRALFP